VVIAKVTLFTTFLKIKRFLYKINRLKRGKDNRIGIRNNFKKVKVKGKRNPRALS
jgi:hypothetical protein